MSDIEVAEHPRWLPVPLQEPDWLPDAVVEVYGEEARPAADAVVSAARMLAETEDPGVVNLLAFALMAEGEAFDPLGFATLRVSHVPETADVTPLGLAARLAEGSTLHADPIIAETATASGPATHLRLRPLSEQGPGDPEVHQLDAVLWPRPERQALFALSHYGTDLVEACVLGDLMVELAGGVRGL